jgi:hypothetical protein
VCLLEGPHRHEAKACNLVDRPRGVRDSPIRIRLAQQDITRPKLRQSGDVSGWQHARRAHPKDETYKVDDGANVHVRAMTANIIIERRCVHAIVHDPVSFQPCFHGFIQRHSHFSGKAFCAGFFNVQILIGPAIEKPAPAFAA